MRIQSAIRLFPIVVLLLISQLVANAQSQCEGNCETGSETPCFTVDLPAPNSSVNLTLFGGGNCCDLQIPDNYNCVQLFVNYPAGTAGLEISSTANPSPCSNDLWDASGGCGNYLGPQEFCEPYCPDQSSIDPNGGTFEFLICKPGNFVDVDIVVTGVPVIIVTTPDVNDDGSDCAPLYSVFGVPVGNTVTWSPTTYLNFQDPDNHTALFEYAGPPVVDCDGIELVYDIVIPATACENAFVETRTVTVYPSIQGSIDVVCSGSDLNMNFIPDVPCPDLLYQWFDENNNPIPGETGPNIILTENDQLYTLAVSRAAVDACPPFTISAVATCCQAPEFISCPSDLVLTTTSATCLTVDYPIPAATSNCGPVTVTRLTGPPPGSDFPLGTPVDIVYEAVNANGQTTLCSFTITLVLDTELTLFCPFDVNICSDPGTCTWIGEGLTPVTSANCGNLELSYEVSGATTVPSTPGDANGVTFNQGISFVTYTLTDITDLTLTEVCTFSVTVNDCEAPILTCPTSITDVECGTEDLIAWAGSASAVDVGACNFVDIEYFVQSTTELCGEAQLDTYLFIATDAAGNQSSCVASYGTVDTSPPTITNPASGLDLECDGNNNATEILAWLNNNGGATAIDGCSPVFWSNDYATVDNPCVNGIVTVTFTASDECGNSATTQADIIINDTTAPTWLLQPANITIECDGTSDPLDQIAAWLNIAGGGEADDDCSFVNYSNNFTELSDGCGATGSATVTFTATDACGNTAEALATVTVVDNTPPSIELPAQDMVVECDGDGNTTELTNWLNANGNAVANDACSNTFTWVNSLVSTISTCGGTEIQTYAFTATDECGNVSVQTSANFIIEDHTPPLITTPPSNPIVQCDGNGNIGELNTWLTSQGGAVASDICSSPLSWGYVLVGDIESCGLTGTKIYRFIVADDCGNTSFADASFTIVDTTNPSIDTEAASETVECDGNGNVAELLAWLNTQGGAVASDLCSGVTWSNNYTAFPYTCAFAGTTTVTFTATDECGNTNSTTASFTIEDTTDPVLTVPTGIELECNDPANDEIIALWLLSASASDGCGEVTITNDYATAPFDPGCGNTGVYTVTFTATDACDLTTSLPSTITIVDTEAPEFVVLPQPLVVDCDDETYPGQIATWVAAFANAIAVDDCGEVTLTISAGVPQIICGGSTITEYTVTATDECNNSVSELTTVTVEDTTPPVITLPDAPDQEYCNNDVVAAQDAWLQSVSAVDECGGGVSIQFYLLDIQEICVGDDTHINKAYLFEAIDDCGNVSTAQDTFTIFDDVSPDIIAPADLVLSCEDEIGAAVAGWLLSYTVIEDCQTYVVTNDYDGTVPDLCGGSLTVTWTVTDQCGASDSASADFIITDDVTGPLFQNCPDDLTVNIDIDLCGSNVVYSSPVAFDCNGPVTVEQTSPTNMFSGDEFPLGDTEITFTATDDCGNTSTCTFTLTVVDSQIPSLACPSNDVVVCASDDFSCNWMGDSSVDPIYGDNCPDHTLTYSISTPSGVVVTGDDIISEDAVIFELGTSVVTYTLIDGSGNQISCTFNVIVEDCTDPVIACPNDLVLECAEEQNDALIAAWTATATDNCDDDPTIDKELITTSSGCGQTETSLYLFTATDDAGNVDYCFANVIIIDTTIPSIDNPAESETVECDGNGNVAELLAWLNTQANAVATDDCGEVTWTNNYSAFTYDCAFTGSTTVTFTATDECGNTNSTTATFTIEDTTDPVLTVPPSIELECNDPANEEIIVLWLLSAYATDACGEVTITNDYDNAPFDPACGNTGVYTVTFTATDECSRTTSLSSNITIVDNTPPVITSPAQDVVTECGPENDAELDAWLNANGQATATDDCSDDELITWQVPELYQTIESCGNTVTYVYLFRAIDECDNVSIFTVGTFTIEDTTPPSFDDFAENETVECDGSGNLSERDAWLQNHGGATATDLCGGEINWTWDLINTIDQCGYTGTYTYRFTATDECGNSDYTDADFIILDTTAPDIDQTNIQNLEVECDGASNAAEILDWLNENAGATASDDCGIIIWTNDYGTLEGGCGGATGFVDVTFTATDECGNASSFTARITINDTVDPIWEIMPQDLTIECDGSEDPYGQIDAWLNTVGGGEAEDDCSYVVYSNDFEELTDGCSDGTGSALVTFTATDACSNDITATATVTVVDTYPPIIYTMARDTVVECDGEGNLEDLENWLANNGGAVAYDLCSEPITWEYELLEDIDLCGGNLEKVYSFRAIDACGNISSNTVAKFIIVFTGASLELLVQDTVVQCDGAGNVEQLFEWLDMNTDLVASDPCFGEASVQFDLVAETDLCGATGEGLYRFSIIDECGNFINAAEATFTIVDTLPPVITGGMDMSMEECEDPPAGNYPEFDDWLSNNAYATAEDVCGQFSWSNNFHPDNWVFVCGNTKYVEVTFYATDVCGNVDSIMHEFSIGDNTPPVFTNCPRPDIVVDVPTNLCEAYVNFSMPYAEDNCGVATVTQTDNTGLSSGDLFPVGCTVLEFTATDDCGNETICYLRVIVNDNHTPPLIECPEDISVMNDPGLCGAVIYDIGAETDDNCPGNVSVIYEIYNESSELVGSGIGDASGTEFPAGNNTVIYTAFDQPIFLITEVVQDGTVSGIEIGNFGPAAIDLGCAVVARTNSSLDEEYTIPHGNELMAGEVFTHGFTSIPAGEEATYSIYFIDRLIDEITINDGLDGINIFRINDVDTDTDEDFEVANVCNLGSFGSWNPQLSHFNDNGTLTGMQSVHPNQSSCTFQVNVVDEESPRCASGNRDATYSDGNLLIDGVTCVSSVFEVQPGIIADINLLNFQVTVENAGLVTVLLTSPWGQEITLLEGVCEGTSDIDINLDDSALENVVDAPCSPLGNGGTYAPIEGFSSLFGIQAAGEWTLELFSDAPNSGIIHNWTLEFFYVGDFEQADIEVENDEGECGALIEWYHPIFLDNCIDGIMTVAYIFNNEVTGETYAINETLLTPGGTINLDGTLASRFFDVGVTEVLYTLIDANGHVGTCGFTVTVNDTEAPTFPLGCEDQTIYLEPEECEGVVSNLPSAEDNCKLQSFYFNVGDEDMDVPQLPIGTNTVHAIAIDIYGNADTCTFIVEVIGYDPEDGTLVCNDDINLSLDPNCEAVLTGDMILEGDEYGCFDNYCIFIYDPDGNIHDNYFDYSDVGLTFTVQISDCLGSQNNCELTVNIMEKYVPEIVCPDDVVVTCNADISPQVLGEVEILNCEPFAEVWHTDEFIDNGICGNPRATIIRTWNVDDNQGNLVTCDQIIEIKKSVLNDVIPPADIWDLDCSEVDADPSLLDPEYTGYPTVEGIPLNENNGLCMFSYLYLDEIYQFCGNSYELLRTWKVRDVCGPLSQNNPKIFTQIIRVFDFVEPEFHDYEDIYVSTSSYDCFASMEIPIPMITDNCNDFTVDVNVSGAVVETSGNWEDGTLRVFASNMGLGTHVVRITATDPCYNENSCVFNIVVEDDVPPIPVCEQYMQVSLTQEGDARVFAEDFDSGSFDNCGPVWFKVMRGNEYNSNFELQYDGGCEDLNGDDNPFAGGNQVWFDDDVFFCCDDLGLNHPDGIMVTLRVFDVDPGPGPVDPGRMYNPDGDLYGRFNDCWTVVELECKIQPLVVAPDLEVNCEANLDPYENTDLYPDIISVCGYEATYEDSDKIGDVCSGYFQRTWTVTGCDKTVTKVQRIYLTSTEPFDPCTISFPADETNIICPENNGDPGEPTWEEYPCNIVTAEIVNIDTFKFVDGACMKIVVDWAVIDWCVYLPNQGAEDNVDAVQNRRLVCDELVEDGYYRYTQILMVTDVYAPEIIVEDQCIATTTGCYAEDVVLEATATDSCNVDEKFWWKYIVVNMDTWETVQYSYNYTPKPDDGRQGSKSKDNLGDGLNGAGVKDARISILDPLPIGNYRVEWTAGDGCGNATSTYQYFTVADNKPPTPLLVDISTALMSNGMVELTARFFDKGACNGECLASFDNCSDHIWFTFTDVAPVITHPEWIYEGLFYFDPGTGEQKDGRQQSVRDQYFAGELHSFDPEMKTAGKVFLCADVPAVNVDVYVWDNPVNWAEGDCDDANYDFGTVLLNLNDESDCDGTLVNLAGMITSHDSGDGIDNVDVKLDDGSNENPIYTTTDDGEYAFDNLKRGLYELSGEKNDDYLNGVSTLDLILIQKHLLDIKALDNVYDLIAADANLNGSISGADMLAFRQLILAVKDELSGGKSWRFLDGEYIFTNELNPWLEMDQAEVKDLVLLQDRSNVNLVGVKLGDLNGSVTANANSPSIESRTSETLSLVVDEADVEVGLIEVAFTALDFNEVYGAQMTINTRGMKYEGVESGALKLGNNNFGTINDGTITMSWNNASGTTVTDGTVLFTLKLKAEQPGTLSSMLSIGSDVTTAEAYTTEQLNINGVDVLFRGAEIVEFELFQNEPNPFTEETVIGFTLPEANEYRLTVFDVAGKAIKVITDQGKKGYNSEIIDREDIRAGVKFYQLESGDHFAIKKMIVIQ